VYDEQVDLNRLIGTNKSFLERELPHIASLTRPSLDQVIAQAEVVVLANSNPAFRHVPELLHSDQILVDLVGIATESGMIRGRYEGICW